MATWTGWRALRSAAADPRALMPEVRSVIMLGMNYAPDADPLAILRQRERGAISVYAQGDDYHEVIKPKLKTLARWLIARAGGDVKVFVDTAALMEKPLAAAARASAGRASTPIWSRANSARGSFSARSSRRSNCRPMRRSPTTAAPAGRVSTSVRPRPSRRRTGSMRGAAFPISPSSTRGRSRANSAAPWATASTAATTASRSAPGTSSRRLGREAKLAPRDACRRRASPNSPGSTTRAFARCSPNRR